MLRHPIQPITIERIQQTVGKFLRAFEPFQACRFLCIRLALDPYFILIEYGDPTTWFRTLGWFSYALLGDLLQVLVGISQLFHDR